MLCLVSSPLHLEGHMLQDGPRDPGDVQDTSASQS